MEIMDKKEFGSLLEQGEGFKLEFKESFEVTKPAVMSGFRGMFGEHTLSRPSRARTCDTAAAPWSAGPDVRAVRSPAPP